MLVGRNLSISLCWERKDEGKKGKEEKEREGTRGGQNPTIFSLSLNTKQ